jgi:FixJ family two-component response regulator
MLYPIDTCRRVALVSRRMKMSSVAALESSMKYPPIPIAGYGYHSYPLANSHSVPIVFVVDQGLDSRESLQLLIGSQSWRVQTFDSVSDFLAGPRPSAPSCLILGFSSANSRCLEIQKRIAKECVEMPIIILADYSDIPTTVEAMKTGAVDFLIKPFGDELLLAAIAKSLMRSRAVLERGMEMRTSELSRFAHSTRTAGDDVGGLGPDEQAGWCKARHQRNHSQGTSGECNAEDEGRIFRAPGERGVAAPPGSLLDNECSMSGQRKQILGRLRPRSELRIEKWRCNGNRKR